MGKYGKPAEFRVNGKVDLAKTDKDTAGVCAESTIINEASLNQQEQLKEDRSTSDTRENIDIF